MTCILNNAFNFLEDFQFAGASVTGGFSVVGVTSSPPLFYPLFVIGTLWKWLVCTLSTAGGYPLVAEMMMIKRMTATTTPMIAIIFMFCHQYFLLRRVAWVWNWFAPSWRLSALWSSSESLLSLSSTFSTLTRMMSTTSPTCACACDSREFPCSGASAILSFSDPSLVEVNQAIKAWSF